MGAIFKPPDRALARTLVRDVVNEPNPTPRQLEEAQLAASALIVDSLETLTALVRRSLERSA